jgi:hypothetical protein
MKVRPIVEDLIAAVQEARPMPLSQSCIVNRQQLLGLLGELEEALPAELSQASTLLKERENVIEDAYAEANRIVELAHAEAAALISKERIYKEALAEIERLRTANDEEILRQRRELDDYVDAKLAAFEAALTKTLTAVQVGRERTAVRLQAELTAEDGHHDPGNFFGDWSDPRP